MGSSLKEKETEGDKSASAQKPSSSSAGASSQSESQDGSSEGTNTTASTTNKKGTTSTSAKKTTNTNTTSTSTGKNTNRPTTTNKSSNKPPTGKSAGATGSGGGTMGSLQKVIGDLKNLGASSGSGATGSKSRSGTSASTSVSASASKGRVNGKSDVNVNDENGKGNNQTKNTNTPKSAWSSISSSLSGSKSKSKPSLSTTSLPPAASQPPTSSSSASSPSVPIPVSTSTSTSTSNSNSSHPALKPDAPTFVPSASPPTISHGQAVGSGQRQQQGHGQEREYTSNRGPRLSFKSGVGSGTAAGGGVSSVTSGGMGLQPGIDLPALGPDLTSYTHGLSQQQQQQQSLQRRLQAQAQAQLAHVRSASLSASASGPASVSPSASASVPPRFQQHQHPNRNSIIRDLPLLYEEESESAVILDDVYGRSPGQYGHTRGLSFADGGREDGAAAIMLSGLAARAHRRTGSDMNMNMANSSLGPGSNTIVQQQINLQQQIEALQAQQRMLLQQQAAQEQSSLLSGPPPPPGFPNVLQGPHGQSQDAMAIQQQYLEILAQQQIQQMQLQQAVMKKANTSANTNAHTGPSGSQRHSMVLAPDTDLPIPHRQPSPADQQQQQQQHHRRGPSISDMGPPPVTIPASTQTHRQRDSFHSHRPKSSIMGSFGGFVNDYEEMPAQTHHHRSASQSWRNGTGHNNANNNGDPNGTGTGGGVMDLGAAQAQLAALSNFRANEIAGGVSGHSKMASFSFPNMLPNLMMASQMGTTTQSAVQQQQAFQMQLQQSTGPGPQRKSLFAPYLPQGSLPALLAAGKLVVGTLRVNKRNRSDAYVATDVLDADIYICGSKDRNRALEGDIVAIELLDVDEVWSSKKDKEEKKRKKEESTQVVARKTNDKRNDDVEVEGQGLVLFEDEEVTDDQKPTYAGHVVAVVERVNNQLFTGQLNVLRPSAAATQAAQQAEGRSTRKDDRPKIVWFKPTDKRVPLIAIPTIEAPADFLDNPDKYANQLFVSTIKRWPITSLHPFGSLVDQLGSIGDIEVETAALLKDCNVVSEEFPEAALKCLPPTPWIIPEHEYTTRRDMRSHRVFTIDPETAKDLDDALSITELEGGEGYEVGVHIADVSYFVKPNNALDRDARKKATSVYLVQRAVPMLPPLLSEQLCSLVPGVDRLAFSCYFKLDKEGNVLSKTFEKSIIKSCAKLAYDDAQKVIDGGKLEKEVDEFPVKEIENDIKLLQSLASKIRSRRFSDGALKIDNVTLSFKLDDETGQPIDCAPKMATAANALIEEYMLLANIAAAQTIGFGLPEQALLRRHEQPIARRIEAFVDRAKRLGFDFNGTSSEEIQKSFDAVGHPGDKLVLQILATRAMNKAKYFCAGMLDISKYSHFALSVPVYTHFTSPIRRYADVLVHRMLEACLMSPTTTNPAHGDAAKFYMERDQVAKCAQQCNIKRDMAKLAQEHSAHLHLCFLIHDLTKRYGPVVRQAKVIGVLDNAFDVVVPEFGIEKRVHVDKMPLVNHVYDEKGQTLSLYWSTEDVLSYLSVDGIHSASPSGTDDDSEPTTTTPPSSAQHLKSSNPPNYTFQDLKEHSGHRIQEIKHLHEVPVIVAADLSKSPPVLIVYAVNPYSSKEK